MKRVKIHLRICFSLVFLLFAGLMPLSAQSDDETVGELCSRLAADVGEDSEFISDCVRDHGGDASVLYRCLDNDCPQPSNPATQPVATAILPPALEPAPETVGDHCSNTSPEVEAFNECIANNGGDANAVYSPGQPGGGSAGALREASKSKSASSSANYVDHGASAPGNVHYSPVTLDGIGHAGIIEQGVLAATDVWGMVPPGTRVCFGNRMGGGVLFKDTSTIKHTVYWLPHFFIDNSICVDLPGSGTVVLVEAQSPLPILDLSSPEPDQTESVPAQAPSSPLLAALMESLGLYDCPLIAGDILNLREGPSLSQAILKEIPYRTRFSATARVGDWFRVEYEEQTGWVHADYVFWRGYCDFPSLESADQTPLPETGRALQDCSLSAGDILNLREEPDINAAVMLMIPYQTRLSASARAGDWLRVEFQGIFGWIHSDYAQTSGDCV